MEFFHWNSFIGIFLKLFSLELLEFFFLIIFIGFLKLELFLLGWFDWNDFAGIISMEFFSLELFLLFLSELFYQSYFHWDYFLLELFLLEGFNLDFFLRVIFTGIISIRIIFMGIIILLELFLLGLFYRSYFNLIRFWGLFGGSGEGNFYSIF